MNLQARVWHHLPSTTRARLISARRWWRRNRPGHRVGWGNLRRRAPFSTAFALDRGLPIDRYYIGAFMASHRSDVIGDVMEMSRSTYTAAHGDDRVRSLTIVDIDRSNSQATHYCDLCQARSLPSEAFDCIVLTQTLQYLADLDTAVANLWQALRPGGVLLLTVPALARDDPVGGDYWRFTPAGLRRVLGDHLPVEADVEVTGFGNAVTAVAQIAATTIEDLGAQHLSHNDPGYPVIVGARVTKPTQT